MRAFGSVVAAVLVVVAAGVLSSSSSAPSTPAGFLSLARLGLDGTYTITYRMGSAPFGDATVIVGQRAEAGESAWLGAPGDWFYRLTSPGEDDEWVVTDGIPVSCWKKGASKPWICTGPGRAVADMGGIGFAIATAPFITGNLYRSIESAVDEAGATDSLFREQGDVCLRSQREGSTWCLDASGHLVSWTSQSPFAVLFLWTTAREVDLSRSAPLVEFLSPVRPRQPFIDTP